MARRASPARLVIALAVAAMLAVFLVYTSIAGGTPQLRPSELKGRTGEVALVGKVVGRVSGDARGDGLRFRLRDVEGTESVPVVYRGSVPDLFKSGRDISLKGRLRNGTFVATPGTLVTKCPSKYVAEKKT
ncbi:MAG TPA: cytochrome c maturation protein CcmE [Gaiellaceae bacterium]|jgi:cytochrome c-type biogenesis protein CcmE|nr:cytochrome c maturation protein CcmE [Gaiellaceae bacterium]